MALSTLGGLAGSAMSNLQRSSEGMMMPLDAIEARRAARAAEAQKQQEADAASMKAAAAKQAAAEQQAAGEAKRAADAQTAQILGNMPQITVDNMKDPAFTQQLREQVMYLQNSGNPEALGAANKIMTQLKSFSETGAIDEGTAQGEMRRADVEAQESQTELNRSMTEMNIPGATKGDMDWAQAFIHGNDPGRTGGFWSSLVTKNYSPEQRIQKGNELASILDQVKREYASQHGGKQMGVQEAQNEAIRRFNKLQGSTVDVQPEPEQAAQTGATSTPKSSGGKLKFDWRGN